MKFSEAWLREWVDPDIGRDELLDQLTMAGLEVDGVEPVAGGLAGHGGCPHRCRRTPSRCSQSSGVHRLGRERSAPGGLRGAQRAAGVAFRLCAGRRGAARRHHHCRGGPARGPVGRHVVQRRGTGAGYGVGQHRRTGRRLRGRRGPGRGPRPGRCFDRRGSHAESRRLSRIAGARAGSGRSKRPAGCFIGRRRPFPHPSIPRFR